MSAESHERARQLITKSQVEGIRIDERDWLEDHLACCPECATAADGLAAAVQSLRRLSHPATPELVQQTRLAVRIRAEQLRATRSGWAPLWIATALSSISMILTTSYVWQAFGWVGRVGHIPAVVWQVGFLMWWFLPATVLAAAAAWRHWLIESNWGHR
jgi:predicted anti-sigma-YlaC factor YlaD